MIGEPAIFSEPELPEVFFFEAFFLVAFFFLPDLFVLPILISFQ